MELIYIFLFCVSLLLLFLHRSSSRSLPPGPMNLPIIGSLHRLGSHPNQSLFELAKIYGPLMTLRLGCVTTIVASSAETAKQVLQIHDQNFSDRTVPDVVASQPNPESTLAWALGDSRWRNRRRICNTQLFTVQRLNSLQHLRHEKVQQLIEHIKKQRVSGSQVNIGQVVFATALNLISTTIFSIDIVDPEFNTAQEFKNLVWRIMEDSAKPNLSDYFPMIKRFDLQGIRKHIRPSYTRLHEIFDEMIDKRMEAKASNSMTRSGDLLDVLLDQCEENGSDFSRQNIKPLILRSSSARVTSSIMCPTGDRLLSFCKISLTINKASPRSPLSGSPSPPPISLPLVLPMLLLMQDPYTHKKLTDCPHQFSHTIPNYCFHPFFPIHAVQSTIKIDLDGIPLWCLPAALIFPFQHNMLYLPR
ncbi:geraniol 8-hydroxylase-like isoform X2 [Durio zibethinus]|uniref:Geraniol 8-hydroxylase-like isoform X2 n=1 Tax=Durio zibethinus TaxID=66656 RepID=A0A6P5WNJ3_DURZI|nr:geraniol 8-hydroxylase-like isoform X2 [Durio zibethinus]